MKTFTPCIQSAMAIYDIDMYIWCSLHKRYSDASGCFSGSYNCDTRV